MASYYPNHLKGGFKNFTVEYCANAKVSDTTKLHSDLKFAKQKSHSIFFEWLF
jgi:hypothetical protein